MTNVDFLYEEINRGREGKNIGLNTGIPKLDNYIGGIQRGNYTLVFGLSGSGKSAWVLYNNIYRPLKDNPDKDIKIIYFSLEMSSNELLARLLSLYLYEEYNFIISFQDLMSWNRVLDDKAYEYVQKGRSWLDSIIDKLLIYDESLTSKSFYAIMMENLKNWGTFSKSTDGRRRIYTRNNPDQWIWIVIDHIGLCSPSPGQTKKQEIDDISSMAVKFREICKVSFYVLMQQNREASNMDRRKAELTELSDEDIKDSGNPYNDCKVCIGIYHPLKYKIKMHKGFPIIIENENPAPEDFIGLRDTYRAAQLIKNRFGQANKIIPVSFYGEIGYWKQLPKAAEIKDFKPYTSLRQIKQQEKEDAVPIKDIIVNKQPLTYSF